MIGRIKAGLVAAGYPTSADYFNAYQYSNLSSALPSGSMPFQHTGGSPSAVDGYGRSRVIFYNSVAASTYCTFTTPFACTAVDIWYIDNTFTSMQYSLDGGGNVQINGSGASAGSTPGDVVQKLSLTGLSNQVHTIAFGTQVGGGNLFGLEGITCYPTGVAAAGIQYARMAFQNGNLTTMFNTLDTSTTLDRMRLFAGVQPQHAAIAVPVAALTGAVSAVAGVVDIGTHFYAVAYQSSAGVTALGPASTGVVTTVSTSGQNSLTAIPLGAAGVVSKRLIYRTKISGNASGPWFLLTTINDNTTTVFTDNVADASLGAGPGTAMTIAGTGAGFPTQPALLVFNMAYNDLPANNFDLFGDTMQRLISAVRRGNPACSILLVFCYITDSVTNDGALLNASYINLNRFHAKYVSLAGQYGCATVSFMAKWGGNPVTKGLMAAGDNHPTDLGQQDMATTILSIL